MPKKEHSLVQKYPSCSWAWECLCWEITGKINKTKSWQVSSWCSRRCDCEVIHHEWVRTVMSVNIDLLNQSLFSLSLSLSRSTLTIITSYLASTNAFLHSNQLNSCIFWATVKTCCQTVDHIPSHLIRQWDFSLYLDWQMTNAIQNCESENIFLSLSVEKVEFCSGGCSRPPIFLHIHLWFSISLWNSSSLKLRSAPNDDHLGAGTKQTDLNVLQLLQ